MTLVERIPHDIESNVEEIRHLSVGERSEDLNVTDATHVQQDYCAFNHN